MTAQNWAEYADAAAALNGGKLQGDAEQYIDAALALDPGNRMALWEKASAQHAAGGYAQAIQTWQRLLSLMPADSPDSKIFAANLAEDQALARAAPTADASAAKAAQVSGEVALADTLRDKVPAGSTLFIVAKSIDSPGPPVAVIRTQTAQWPLKFVLDDSLAMLPTRTLSKVGRVTVEARISLSGAATAHSGDLQSSAAAIDPRERKALRLVIDRVIG
jgi:cytochrome c-type biogenesis protein CcmH